MPDLPQNIMDRVLARRGCLHIHDWLSPAKTALLAIDMQNAYLDADQPGYVRNGLHLVKPINQLAGCLRDAGGLVIWLRNTLGPDIQTSWPPYAHCRTGALGQRMIAALAKGSWGHSLCPQVDVRKDDFVIDKYRYSAFIRGSSGIENILLQREIDTLLIAGLLANTCCESTARDAMMLNYFVIAVSDAMGAHTEEEKWTTLSNIILSFGDVVTSEHAHTLLNKGLNNAPIGPSI